MAFIGGEDALQGTHWKVLLAGLAEHESLINKLSKEGHEIQVTNGLAEACICLAGNSYDLIIIDADGDQAELAMVREWLAHRSSGAEVIVLTRWRSPAAKAVKETDSQPK